VDHSRESEVLGMSAIIGIPSAEDQITFLKKIQTLFDDSSFNATYKYALLITLTDLAIEYGDDQGKPLELKSELIATRFSEIYWPQIKEFSTGVRGTSSGVLSQNNGGQAEIITTLQGIAEKLSVDDFSKVIGHKIWQQKLGKITRTIWENPVFYLQDDSNQFIYKYSSDRTSLTLTSDAGFCLRKFSEYIIQYAKQGWIEHIKSNKRNQPIIGPKDDLESFLFGNARDSLNTIRPLLLDCQSGKCFYCNKSVIKASDVDHFIPWKKYPRNIAQNLVLSCPSCNRSKSDMLAAKNHLEKWKSEVYPDNKRSILISQKGFINDQICSLKVAQWAYVNAVTTNGNTWIHKKEFQKIMQADIRILL
jgi:5-methylcytosine-specific restriction endonuclease McrA